MILKKSQKKSKNDDKTKIPLKRAGFFYKTYSEIMLYSAASSSNLIFALGIDNVGKKTAKILANRFKTMENLQKATIAEFVEIDDIGELMANDIHFYFENEENGYGHEGN